MPPGRALALALIPGVAIALSLHFAVLGLRPHLFTLLGEPRLLFKLCLTFLLAALSCALVARIARPGVSIRRMTLLLAIVPALLAAAIPRGTPRCSGSRMGPKTCGHQCDILLEDHPLSCRGPARCRLAGLASRRSGASRPCRSGGRPLRRGDQRAFVRHALPGRFAAFRGGLVYVGDWHRRRCRRRGGVPAVCAGEGHFCFDPRSKARGWLQARRGS